MKVISTENQLLEKSKHVGKLLSLGNADIMNIQLKAGEGIPEHDSKREVIIVVRKGVVTFTVEGKDLKLQENDCLHMEPFEKHSLTAIEDTDILVFQIES